MKPHCCAAIVIVLLVSTALRAQEHPIKLDRLPKAGTVIEVTSQTEQSGDLKTALSKVLRWGVTGSYRTTADVVARITVEETDASGWATKASVKVLRFDVSTGKQKTATDIRGKVFQIAVHNGRRVFLEPTGVKGENYVLDEPRASIMDLAIPLRFVKGEVGLDEMFGTTTPQKLGGKWNADPNAIAKAFSYWEATKERSLGSATLKKTVGKSLTIETTLSVSGLKFKNTTFNLPADYTLTDAKHEMTLTTTLNTEEGTFPSAQSIKLSYSASGTLKGKSESESDKSSGQTRYKVVK